MGTEEIYNFIRVDENIATSGQPTEAQFKLITAEGFTTLINLVPADNRGALPNEASIAEGLGLTYVHIPVNWQDPQESDFDAFDQAMSQPDRGKTFIHCAANFRVTAFYSLFAQKRMGWTEEQAESFRARIWAGSNYPIWEDFIERMTAKITR